MNKEQQFFLQALKQHIFGEYKSIPTNDIDFNLLIFYAVNHQMAGIIYYQLKNTEFANFCESLKEYSGADIFYYLNRKSMLKDIFDKFSKNNISCFLIKGAVIADYYTKPELRTMGDADIVIHPYDRETAHKIMLDLGFSCSQDYVNEWLYKKSGIEFEIHTALVYDSIINTYEITELFNDCWKYVKEYDGVLSIDLNYHLLYLFLHIRKHILLSGVGLRQFLDIAVLIKSEYNKLNWEWIETTLEQINLLKFAKVCFGLIEEWFDISVPIVTEKINSDFLEYATQKIFSDGVFGLNPYIDKYNDLVNNIRENDNKKSFWIMFRLAFSKVFPNYSVMLNDGRYRKFIYNKPYKLPLVWIMRLYDDIKLRGIKYGTKQIKNSFASSKTIKREIEIIEKWGL